MVLLSQLIGFAALAACVTSFQCKTYSKLILLQAATSLLFMTHFGLLALSGTPSAWTAAVSNVICLVRNLVYYFTAGKDGPFSQRTATILKSSVFAFVLVVFGIITWGGIASLFCTIAMVLITISVSVQKPQKVRMITLIAVPFMLTYDVMTFSIAGVLNESISAISALVGLWRYRTTPEHVS